jgi:hypothetical protein
MDYWNEQLLERQSKDKEKRVYVRYDPDDIRYVHIYDIEDRYLMTVPMDEMCRLRWGASKNEVADAQKRIRTAKRYAIAKANEYGNVDPETKIELMSLLALQNTRSGEDKPIRGKTIEPIRPAEDSIPKKPSKAEVNHRDLISEERMNRNIEQRMKGVV